jgi:hypothetical protein
VIPGPAKAIRVVEAVMALAVRRRPAGHFAGVILELHRKAGQTQFGTDDCKGNFNSDSNTKSEVLHSFLLDFALAADDLSVFVNKGTPVRGWSADGRVDFRRLDMELAGVGLWPLP